MPVRTWPARLVEENEIKRKTHAEGVDGGAAWDQQTGPSLVPVEMREAKQAAAERRRDPDLMSGNRRNRQPAESMVHLP